MDNIFVQFAIILSISSILGLVALKLKLPLIVSYLLTGVAISAFSVFRSGDSMILHVLPEIGIAFVLFLIGMELDLKEVKSLGLPIILTAIGQVIISTFLGFLISGLLGFGQKEGIFVGLGLAFSSTVVVVKMLIEHRDLSSLHGKLSIGMLLVEDVVAITCLMVISVSASAFNLGLQDSWPIFALILKGLGLFVLTFVLSKYLLRKLFDKVAKSTELLFFTSITWCFIFTALSMLAGFSVEIGAFLAGVSLASSPYHFQIQGKIKPLRDFFLTLFFIYLGSQIRFDYLADGIWAIIIFSIYALLVKPLIYILLLSRFGFRKHTLYLTALNLSQISEFSLIVLVVGLNYKVVSPMAVSVMATVGVISIISSSILISQSRKLYGAIIPFIRLIERKRGSHYIEIKNQQGLMDHVVVIGADRIGRPLVEYLTREKIPLVVMDFNPHVVKMLEEKGVNVIYGDVGDPDVIESLDLENTKLIISTAPALEDNEILLTEIRKRKSDAKIVMRAEDKNHAEVLKKLGADYVILPEKVSGVYLVNQIKTHWPKIVFTGLS